MLIPEWTGSFIGTDWGVTAMTYDELKKVEDRVPPTPEQMAKPLAEALDPGMAFAIARAETIQFLVRGPEEKQKLITKRGIAATHIWTLPEVASLLGPDVTLGEATRAFGSNWVC
jgi:hypothetical protein